MYEENENKIQWGPILKKVGMLAVALLVIFGIFTLVNKCSRNNGEEKPNKPAEISLEKPLDELEKATLEYLTTDNLPTELNGSKTIRLKILINRSLTDGIKDEENNQCDTSESYSEVTRLENNYAVKMSISCGKNKASRVIYVGCFSNCEGGICKGEETQTDGVCGAIEKPEDKEPDVNETPTTSTDNVVQPNVTPSTSAQTKPSTNNTNTNKDVLYEFRRCVQKPIVCNKGELNPNSGYCEVNGWKTVFGEVVQTGINPNNSTNKVPAQLKTKTSTVTLKPSQAKNTSTVTYKLIKMNGDGTCQYTKTEQYYACDGNIDPINGYCYYTVSNPEPVYGCKDKTYTYNASTGTCTKKEYTVIDWAIPGTTEVCETTTSYSQYLEGWTRIGYAR